MVVNYSSYIPIIYIYNIYYHHYFEAFWGKFDLQIGYPSLVTTVSVFLSAQKKIKDCIFAVRYFYTQR